MKNLIIPLFFVFNLTACVTTIGVPDHVKSPMTRGKDVLDISGVGAVGPASEFIFPDDAVGPANIIFPDDEETAIPNPNFGLKLSYGITDTVDVGLEFAMQEEPEVGFLSLEVKYQWLGKSIFQTKQSDWNSATQLKVTYGEGGGSENKDERAESWEGEGTLLGFSLSNSFGYMVWDWLAVYGGAQVGYMFADYKVNIVGKESTTKKIEDHIWRYGPFAGIQLNTVGSHWKIIFALEAGITNVPSVTGWDKGEKRNWELNQAVSASILLQF